jgi:carotenoid cleavage dioxygenase-like enzyme
MVKFGGLAKLHFKEPAADARFNCSVNIDQELIKMEYHMFEKNTFCTDAAFVLKEGGFEEEEDDGWIITFIHNEDTNISQVSNSI